MNFEGDGEQQPAEESLRFCRICYDDSDGGDLGFLFRPCLCTGTCGLVHVSCLNAWRDSSANTRSQWECDQCKYKYKFGPAANVRLNMVEHILSARWFAELASIVVLLLSIVICGVLIDVVAPGFFDPMDIGVELGYTLTAPLRILISGASGVGLTGCAVSMLSHGTLIFRQFYYFPGGRRDCDIMKVIAIVVGLGIAYYHIYKWLRRHVVDGIRRGATVILDVDTGKAPSRGSNQTPQAPMGSAPPPPPQPTEMGEVLD